MSSWSTSALLLLVGIGAGPSGLNLLSPSVLLLLDPVVAMALAMLGVFVGLGIDVRHPRLTTPAVLTISVGVAMAVLRGSSASVFMVASILAVALPVAFAGWLLVGQADSDREQQVFAIGSLLLIGGSAVYASLSAVFAGLLAGMVWSIGGGLAKARIAKHLDYFQHPVFVVMLLSAGASMPFSLEAVAVAVIVAAFHAAGRPVADPFPVSSGAAAIAVALDVFRGIQR